MDGCADMISSRSAQNHEKAHFFVDFHGLIDKSVKKTIIVVIWLKG